MLDYTKILSYLQELIIKRLTRFEEYVSVVSKNGYILIRIISTNNLYKFSFVITHREVLSLYELNELALLAKSITKRYKREKRELLYGWHQ